VQVSNVSCADGEASVVGRTRVGLLVRRNAMVTLIIAFLLALASQPAGPRAVVRWDRGWPKPLRARGPRSQTFRSLVQQGQLVAFDDPVDRKHQQIRTRRLRLPGVVAAVPDELIGTRRPHSLGG